MAESSKRVLLVDDDQLVRECIGAILENVGYKVRAAAGSDEAMEHLLHHPVDLIILDIHLGGGGSNGVTFCRRIRALRAFEKTPILMMTGESSRDMVVEAARAGANGYILKSTLSIPDFVDRLNKALAPAEATAPAAVPVKDAPANEEEIEKRLARVSRLRALPFVAAELGKLASTLAATPEDLVNVIRRDPALVLRVLEQAPAGPQRVKDAPPSLERAVIGLGFSGLRELAADLPVTENFYASPDAAPILARWQHSLACALLARAFAGGAGTEDGEAAYLAGLLHDVGRGILAEAFPESYPAVIAEAATGIALSVVEKRHLGVDHVQAARRLLAAGKFPAEILVPVAAHHETWLKLLQRKLENPTPAAAVFLAERVLATQELGSADDDLLDEAVEEPAQFLNLTQSSVAAALDQMGQDLDELCAIYYLHMPDDASPPPLSCAPPLEEPARKALWIRAREPRLCLVSAVLRRLGFAVTGSGAPAQAAELKPDLVLVPVDAVEEFGDQVRIAREVLLMPGTAGAQVVLLAPEAAAGKGIDPKDAAIHVATRPLCVSRLAALLGPPSAGG